MALRFTHIVLWLVLALSVAAAFVFQTTVVTHVEMAALLAGLTAACVAFLAVFGGIPRLADLRALGIRDGSLVVLAGVLSTAVSPGLVMTNRASDVPPGAVVVFWTAAVWGALLVLAAAVPNRRATWAAAALVAVVGAMGVLGNWERPSSFSLLVRYPDREVAMVAGGILLAVSMIVLSRLAQRHGRRSVYLPAAFSGFLVALVWGAVRAAGDVSSLMPPAKALPYVAAGGLALALTLELTRRAGAHVAGAAYFVAPSALTMLLFVEEATGVFGPRPILVDAAGWASLVLAGALLVILAPSPSGAEKDSASNLAPKWMWGPILALVGVAFAGVALLSSGVSATVTGTTREGAAFLAQFELAGFRTVGGWMALGLSLLALAAWLERPSRIVAYASAIGGAVAVAAYEHVRFTPLHTWISWIPSEVQHDYGTEYANIVFEPVSVDAQAVAIAIAFAALAALAVYRTTSKESGSRDAHPAHQEVE